MLIAAKHKKNRSAIVEDEVTSCVFEPLTYMPLSDVWAFFQDFFCKQCDMDIKTVPTKIDFIFWPNIAAENRIEPDLLVDCFKNGVRILTLMIEVKWNSSIYPEKELFNQWSALDESRRSSCIHIYLVKKSQKEFENLKKSLEFMRSEALRNIWEKRLLYITWQDIGKFLSEGTRSTTTNAFKSWSQNMIAFLYRGNLMPYEFTGFDTINSTFIPIFDDCVFWQPHDWFCFSHIKIDINNEPIFFGY
jgi:hypothetical protein